MGEGVGRVIVAGPISTAGLRRHLEDDRDLPAGRGGEAVTRVVRGLLDAGIPVTVVTADGAVTAPRGEVVAEGPELRVRYVPYRSRHRARDRFAVERAALTRAIDREPDGLVHAHWTYEYAMAAQATGRPTLVTVRDWGPTILRLNPTPYRLVRLLMQGSVLRRTGYLTANSPYLAAKVRRWVRRPVPVIGNPIDRDQFGPPRRGPDVHAPTLLAVNAGWSRRKNVATLLRAFAEVRRDVPARLELVGPGYGRGGPAHRWATERGLADHVSFHDQQPLGRVLDAMRAADVLVHPSLEESFGNVLVEAMAQGLPVIGGHRSGAVPWVLGGGAAGLLTDVTDPSALAAAIRAVCSDPGRWRQLSQAGRDNAESRFRTDAVVASYRACYEAVLAGAPLPVTES